MSRPKLRQPAAVFELTVTEGNTKFTIIFGPIMWAFIAYYPDGTFRGREDYHPDQFIQILDGIMKERRHAEGKDPDGLHLGHSDKDIHHDHLQREEGAARRRRHGRIAGHGR